MNKTLFDHLQLQQHYTLSDFGKNAERDLLLLIANNESSQAIEKYVKETVLTKGPETLHYHDPLVRNVTALHLAVMKERSDLILLLLNAGAEPNALDEGKWTPYHLTALVTNFNAMRTLFTPFGVNQELETGAGDSYLDLLAQTGKIPQKWSMANTSIEEESGIIPLTDDNLHKIGLERYTDTILFAPEAYSMLWKKTCAAVSTVAKKWTTLLRKNPPKLIVARDPELARFAGRCFGLKAGQQISAGSPICMYAGPIVPQRLSNFFAELINQDDANHYDFAFQEGMMIRPLGIGNAARYMNDGPPSVYFRHLPGRGMIAIALKDIKQGEFLHFNYATYTPLKWLGSVLKDKEWLRLVFKQAPLHELLQKAPLNPAFSPARQKIESRSIDECLNFALWTPSAIIYLSLTQTVSAQEWFDAFDRPKIFVNVKKILKNSPLLISWMLVMLDELLTFETWLKTMEKTSPKEAENIRHFLIEQLDELNIHQLIGTFKMLSKTYHLIEKPNKEWIASIIATNKTHDWKTSPLLPKFSIDEKGNLKVSLKPDFGKLLAKYAVSFI